MKQRSADEVCWRIVWGNIFGWCFFPKMYVLYVFGLSMGFMVFLAFKANMVLTWGLYTTYVNVVFI